MFCPTCIIGLGLIGGSLLRVVAARGQTVYGFNRSASGLCTAITSGFDAVDALFATLKRARSAEALMVIPVPVSAEADILAAIVAHAPNCGFTDVVSVKAEVLRLVEDRNLESHYVGSHAMAGTADSGWNHSHTGVFKQAAWAIAFDYAVENENPGKFWIELFTDVTKLIQLAGAEAIPVQVANHDAAVARVSHLPHVLAEALAVVGDSGGILAQSLAA